MREKKESGMAFRILIWATMRTVIHVTEQTSGRNEELSFGLVSIYCLHENV